MNSEEFLLKVQEYFYRDEKFAMELESFVKHNAYLMDLTTDENKLIYTKLHDEYKKILEKSIEEYIESLGFNVIDFYKALQEEMDLNLYTKSNVFGEILSSIADFNIFLNLMKEGARSIEHK
jgi:hypothetical protein